MSGWGAGNPLSDPNRLSAAEEATAAGFGTLSTRPKDQQRLQASGSWKDGRWRVILRRPLSTKAEGDLPIAAGKTISVAIAVFDGSAKDRNGQKNVSVWNTLHLER
jgi:DMSO reductase family type II enzyme heme b subunit